MSLDPRLRAGLSLPAIAAPMFLVTTPELVREACLNGVVGALPRHNARAFDQFEAWLGEIRGALDAAVAAGASVAPLAVNLPLGLSDTDLKAHLDVCARFGVEIIINAQGDPTELTRRVHDWGGRLFHDVTSIRFAEKALAAGVDGLTCIAAGGGGHSGVISPLALIPRIRAMFDGTIVLAGAIADGAAIRAAEVLGADLAYLGTRFIATRESGAAEAYKQMLVEADSTGLMYTGKIAGVPANWLIDSMRAVGLDPVDLPEPLQKKGHDHLPAGVTPWRNLWSGGQGVELIDDVPTVAELIGSLRRQYISACQTADMAQAARLAEQAMDRPQ